MLLSYPANCRPPSVPSLQLSLRETADSAGWGRQSYTWQTEKYTSTNTRKLQIKKNLFGQSPVWNKSCLMSYFLHHPLTSQGSKFICGDWYHSNIGKPPCTRLCYFLRLVQLHSPLANYVRSEELKKNPLTWNWPFSSTDLIWHMQSWETFYFHAHWILIVFTLHPNKPAQTALHVKH